MTPKEWANKLKLKHVDIHVSALGHPNEGASIPGWQVANGEEIIMAAVAEERERCAVLAAKGKITSGIHVGPLFNAGWDEACQQIAKWIRKSDERTRA